MIPIAFGIISFVQQLQIKYDGGVLSPWIILPPYLAIGLLQVISFVFLGTGIFLMRKTMKEHGMENQTNGVMTLLHLVAVSAYLIVGVLVYDNVLNEIFRKSVFDENRYITLCIFD